jgi:hypothetical protein
LNRDAGRIGCDRKKTQRDDHSRFVIRNTK